MPSMAMTVVPGRLYLPDVLVIRMVPAQQDGQNGLRVLPPIVSAERTRQVSTAIRPRTKVIMPNAYPDRTARK
jgi:hypothetical protein